MAMPILGSPHPYALQKKNPWCLVGFLPPRESIYGAVTYICPPGWGQKYCAFSLEDGGIGMPILGSTHP